MPEKPRLEIQWSPQEGLELIISHPNANCILPLRRGPMTSNEAMIEQIFRDFGRKAVEVDGTVISIAQRRHWLWHGIVPRREECAMCARDYEPRKTEPKRERTARFAPETGGRVIVRRKEARKPSQRQVCQASASELGF